MEWLWTLVVLAILFGPVIFVFARGRGGGGPSREDVPNATYATDQIRDMETGGRGGQLGPR